VGLKNIFEAEVVGHDPERKVTHIRWFGAALAARHAPQFGAGARVAWSIPASHNILHRRDRPSRGERENPVAGAIVRCIPMGEMTAVALRVVHGERADIFFSVPTHVAERNGLAVGETAHVSLLTEGIHLMPATHP
jgi:molybdate transport system ATP-binding protein